MRAVGGSVGTVRRALPVAGLALLVGAAGGYLAGRWRATPESQGVEIRGSREGLTNPLLDCEVGSYQRGRELRPFREEVAALVGRLERGAGVREVAVYFRDLDNGPWFGIDEKKSFTPGSLFKVPVILAALRQAELVPGYFDQRVVFPGLPDPRLAMTQFEPAETLVPGREYAVSDLLRRVAAHSDNAATWLLRQTVRPEIQQRVFADLGFDPARMELGGRTLTAKDYGRFFRILYNASYLSRPLSEFALRLFADAAFRDGLVAGVPAGTVVAHKFGERGEQGDRGELQLQLHDCGIVYHPGRPYLLCVMTEGSDYKPMAQAIAQVSAEVYGAVARQSGPAPPPLLFP